MIIIYFCYRSDEIILRFIFFFYCFSFVSYWNGFLFISWIAIKEDERFRLEFHLHFSVIISCFIQLESLSAYKVLN